MVKPTPKRKRSPGRGRQKEVSAKVTAEERYRLIEEAAYLRAEKDNFREDSLKYWVEAEAEVNAQLDKKK